MESYSNVTLNLRLSVNTLIPTSVGYPSILGKSSFDLLVQLLRYERVFNADLQFTVLKFAFSTSVFDFDQMYAILFLTYVAIVSAPPIRYIELHLKA